MMVREQRPYVYIMILRVNSSPANSAAGTCCHVEGNRTHDGPRHHCHCTTRTQTPMIVSSPYLLGVTETLVTCRPTLQR